MPNGWRWTLFYFAYLFKVGKTHEGASKIWQTLGDALNYLLWSLVQRPSKVFHVYLFRIHSLFPIHNFLVRWEKTTISVIAVFNSRSSQFLARWEKTCSIFAPCRRVLYRMLQITKWNSAFVTDLVWQRSGQDGGGGGDPALRAAPVPWQRCRRLAKASSVRLLLMKGWSRPVLGAMVCVFGASWCCHFLCRATYDMFGHKIAADSLFGVLIWSTTTSQLDVIFLLWGVCCETLCVQVF
jgi:hypothetical protein